jgi:type IV secretory pathway component VirB8
VGQILKLDNHDEDKEIAFEVKYLSSLTTKQRFEMMFKKSDEIRGLLKSYGNRKNTEITKRT